MKSFTRTQEKFLIALAVVGLVVPNGLFVYYSLFAPAVLRAAFTSPVALVFILEAFLLMILFAWLIHHGGLRSPGWLAFRVMSLVGSMAFSVPAFLYLANRKAQSTLQIREANPADGPQIAAVLAESFAEYKPLYTEKAYAATTPDGDTIQERFAQGTMWVAVFGGKIVGTVSAVPENQSLYIRSMAILPAARGAGIGERLLEEIENFAVMNGYQRLFLSTTPFLQRAIRLYEKFGFERNDEPPHELYGTPLVTMHKNLMIVDFPEGGDKLPESNPIDT